MVGQRLFEERTKLGMSLAEVAKAAGVTKTMVYRYENGVKPSRKNLEKIAASFNKPTSYFLTENITQDSSFSTQAFNEKLKKISEFSTGEKQAIDSLLDQIIEKRELRKKLVKIVSEHSD